MGGRYTTTRRDGWNQHQTEWDGEEERSSRKAKGSLCQTDSWKSVCLCLSEHEVSVTRGEAIQSEGEEEKVVSEKKLSDSQTHEKIQQLEADISFLKCFTLCFDGCFSSLPSSSLCPPPQSKHLLKITKSNLYKHKLACSLIPLVHKASITNVWRSLWKIQWCPLKVYYKCYIDSIL